MAIRIRLYPQQYGGMGMNRFGMNGMGAVSAATYYNSKLTTQRQVSSLQLGYERALANERIERARLEERMKNPYALMGGAAMGYSPMMAGYNPYAASMIGSSLLGSSNGFFGSLGLGGIF